jgi:citrate lyase subunit beta/citryl-CoA lyase
MAVKFSPAVAPLFVPATRPERIAKAANSGADAIIVDLEDAVAVADKDLARAGLADYLADLPVPCFIRVNAVTSDWFYADMELVRRVEGMGVMLPKSETAADIEQIGPDIPVIALVETARGIVGLPDICQAQATCQLAFGSIDYSLDVGCDETAEALLLARSSLVTYSRAFGLTSPIDGVTVSVNEQEQVMADASYARQLGFGGKLAIHPNQISTIKGAFAPSHDQLDWARRVMHANEAADGAAVLMDGQMVDTPIIEKARQMLRTSQTVL